MFQKLKQKITVILGTSMETISSEDIDHAILVSNLTGKPTHCQGDWFVWYDTVLPKRMLLLVLVVGYEQEVNVGFAATKVMNHYRHVMHQIPAKYRIADSVMHQITAKYRIADYVKLSLEVVNDVWLKIQRKLPKANVSLPWISSFAVAKLPRLNESQIQEIIVNTWSQEYD